MTTIDAPRTALPVRRRAGMNVEKWGWIYMRVSGVLLLVLIFGHLFVNLMTGDGIKALDFAFVGGKWSDPFWQVWDCAMLVARAHPRRQRDAHHRQRLRAQPTSRPSSSRAASLPPPSYYSSWEPL